MLQRPAQALQLQRLQLVAAGASRSARGRRGRGSSRASLRLLHRAAPGGVADWQPVDQPACPSWCTSGRGTPRCARRAGCARRCRRRRCARPCHLAAPCAVSTSPSRAPAPEVDVEARGHGHLVVGIAGVGKGRVGQRGDQAAVADVVAVEHVLAHRSSRAWPCPARRPAPAMPRHLRRAVVGPHRIARRPRRVLGRAMRARLSGP